MKTNTMNVETTGRRRSARRVVAAAVVSLLALSACTSDPGPRRVAQDIIEAEAVSNPNLDEECLLEQLDEFSDGDLEEIGNKLRASNADDQNEGAALLAEYEAALATCN